MSGTFLSLTLPQWADRSKKFRESISYGTYSVDLRNSMSHDILLTCTSAKLEVRSFRYQKFSKFCETEFLSFSNRASELKILYRSTTSTCLPNFIKKKQLPDNTFNFRFAHLSLITGGYCTYISFVHIKWELILQ